MAPAPSPALERPQHPVDPSGWPSSDRVNHQTGAHKHASPPSHNHFKRLGSVLAEHKIWTGVGAFMALSIIVYAANPHAANGGAHSVSAPAATGTATPTLRPASTTSAPATAASSTTARKASFPPKTLADFRVFAATGDASEVHQVGTATDGLPSCPEPSIYVTVSPALTARELEADLSAFFVRSGLINSRCQAFVFAYHSRNDYKANMNNGYTAGRVALTNTGPGLQRNLEVDAGDVYDFPAQFDFNF